MTSKQENRQHATAAALAAARDADPATRARLEDEVVRLNLGVATEVAQRYSGRGIPIEDLRQVAALGLVKAVRRFDSEMATDFLGYAVPTIRGELRRHFRDAGWMVRPPRSIQELQARVTAADGELHQILGRPPRPEEVGDHLGVSTRLVVEALAATGCFAPTSLDGAGLDEESVLARLGEEDAGYGRADARVTLRSLVHGLSSRERRILELRFVRGCTQAEIGSEIGVTQTQVSRQLTRLLERLRVQFVQGEAA